MSEKEKALELIHKFQEQQPPIFQSNDMIDASFELAGNCAIVAVKEIIKELENVEFNYGLEETFPMSTLSKSYIPYWDRVITELEALK